MSNNTHDDQKPKPTPLHDETEKQHYPDGTSETIRSYWQGITDTNAIDLIQLKAILKLHTSSSSGRLVLQ